MRAVMETEPEIFKSSLRSSPQMTGRLTILAAQIAASEGRQHEAERLLALAHELFAEQLPSNYVSSDWIEEADDR